MPCMGQNPFPLKINFFFCDKDLFCFNVSFLFISQFRPTFLKSYGLAFVPKCYQYSWCNQLLSAIIICILVAYTMGVGSY